MEVPPSLELGIDDDGQWSVNSTDFILERFAGSPAFFSLYVDVDDKNSSVHVLQVFYIKLSANLSLLGFVTMSMGYISIIKTALTLVYTCL